MKGTQTAKPRIVRGPVSDLSRRSRRRDAEGAVNASLRANDPRWVFALRVQEALQGACLPIESRQRLNKLARVIGLNAFQCNLVIAIVQDAARRGRSLQIAAPSLAMVPENNPKRCVKWRKAAMYASVFIVLEAVVVAWFVL